MRAEGREVSIAKLCRWFGVSRSSFYYRPGALTEPVIDAALAELIRRVIEENPAYGLRRIIRLNGWQVWRKPQGNRPRAQGWTSCRVS
jgi:putative transposase